MKTDFKIGALYPKQIISNPEQIISNIEKMQVSLMEAIIKYIWKDNVDDYGIEEGTIGVILSDFYVDYQDMRQIVKYKIPREVCFEFWDYHSLNCTQDWIEEEKKENDYFLKTLYLFYKKRLGKTT